MSTKTVVIENKTTLVLKLRSDDPKISVDLPANSDKVNKLVNDRIGAAPVNPELVDPKDIRDRSVYKRFNDLEKKDAFREKLLDTLYKSWKKDFGQEKAIELTRDFIDFADNLDEKGAVVFGAILSSENFQMLIDEYTKALNETGSKSWIHTYVNLANHPEFLTNKKFNSAFLHPLLIALVSYRVGGAIRVVDARGKDAEPIKVLAQDNMLHIDNTPFYDEYKVILTWEKNKPSGPKGQNFVFLPGTHKGARQCMINKQGAPWSSENASIFINKDNIEQVLQFQENTLGKRAVVELTHETKPLTTLFAAGSLVHHRYRTAEGLARSCMILAFHRAEDNEGQLIAKDHLEKTAAKSDKLYQLLFGHQGSGSEAQFLEAISEKSSMISDLFSAIENGETEAVNTQDKELNHTDHWIHAATDAPTVEEKKIEGEVFFPLDKELSPQEFLKVVIRQMLFDKHGPLDLILYPDAHEEIRKWARNQIREKNVDLLGSQMETTWQGSLVQPKEEHLLTPEELQTIAETLAEKAQDYLDKGVKEAALSSNEKISGADAYRSVKQLLLDLGEAITRCEDRTAFLSTSLFIFWAADTLLRLEKEHNPEIKVLGEKLLANYIATGVLIDKQILSEGNSN